MNWPDRDLRDLQHLDDLKALKDAVMRTHYYCVFVDPKDEFKEGLYSYWLMTASLQDKTFELHRVTIFETQGMPSQQKATITITDFDEDPWLAVNQLESMQIWNSSGWKEVDVDLQDKSYCRPRIKGQTR